MPESPSDAPLPEGSGNCRYPLPAVPTEEATIHDDAIVAYTQALPRWPIMTAGPED